MLRVAGKRLSSSLSWRPAAAAARNPLAGAGAPGGDDDSARGRSQPRFSIEHPFFAAARGKRAVCPPPASCVSVYIRLGLGSGSVPRVPEDPLI